MNQQIDSPPRENAAVPESVVLAVDGLTVSYQPDGSQPVLCDIGFDVKAGELISVVGPSGAGKTTLLNCISGLLKPSLGTVTFADQAVDRPPNGMAMVFQDYSRSLLPWLSVIDNVMLPLRRSVSDKTRRREAAQHALVSVGLADADDLKPHQLSGGMQQRVAIARALAYEPLVLVMDEPFASVDAQTREDLEDLTLQLRREYAVTIVLVTHDIDEAVYMSDRIVVLGSKPTTVLDVLDVDLGTERDQLHTKSLVEFAEIRAKVRAGIRGEGA